MLGGDLLNIAVTSKAEILRQCRLLVAEKGMTALTMRAVAQRCGVALGSLYNYFPSKTDLSLGVIESVWQDIFHLEGCENDACPFPDYVQRLFCRVEAGMRAYPRFFAAHSLSFASEEKGKARETMERYFAHMQEGLRHALDSDRAVRGDAFDASLTRAALAEFTLSTLVSLWVRHSPDCQVLIELLRRALY